MRKLILVAGLMSITWAAADTHIPGTQVSYKVKREALDSTNASMVFVDALEDKSGKTYATFACDLGIPFFRLYGKTPFVSRATEDVGIVYRADRGEIRDALAQAREDTQTGKLSVLQFGETTSNMLLKLFLTAKTNVIVRVERDSMNPLTLTFPVRGFYQAYKSIDGCE